MHRHRGSSTPVEIGLVNLDPSLHRPVAAAEQQDLFGLALDAQLAERKMQPRCGIYVVDMATGDIVHSLTIDGVIPELYDVAVISDHTQPAALGAQSPEVRRMISIGPSQTPGTAPWRKSIAKPSFARSNAALPDTLRKTGSGRRV